MRADFSYMLLLFHVSVIVNGLTLSNVPKDVKNDPQDKTGSISNQKRHELSKTPSPDMTMSVSYSPDIHMNKRQPARTDTASEVSLFEKMHLNSEGAVGISGAATKVIPPAPPRRSSLYTIIEQANIKKALDISGGNINKNKESDHIAETSFITQEWEAEELKYMVTVFHRELRSFFGREGVDFHRFSEYHPVLSEELSEFGLRITILETSGRLSSKLIRDYFRDVSAVFQLMEMAYGLKPKRVLSDKLPFGGAKSVPNTSKILLLEASADTIREMIAYLTFLLEAQENISMELTQDREPQTNLKPVPRSKKKGDNINSKARESMYAGVTEGDLEKVEKSLESLHSLNRFSCEEPEIKESGKVPDPPSGETALHGSETYKDEQRRQRFAVRFLSDRLHFVRQSLQECTHSACLGFNLYDTVSDRLRNICLEVQEQIENSKIIDLKSKRLLLYLSQATQYKWIHRKNLFTASSGNMAHVDDSEPDLRDNKYSLKEADGVRMELENIAARLKSLQNSNSSLESENLSFLFNEIRESVRSKEIYIQDKYWYWTSRGSVVKLMEAEIYSMLKSVQTFVMDSKIFDNCRQQQQQRQRQEAWVQKMLTMKHS